MSWLFSQVLVEEYLGDICSDGEQSVQLNGKPTQQAYLSQDKMTKYSRLSQFGMTYKPLTENRGEELLTLYLEDFHAKTSQQLGGGLESQEQEVQCGNTWHGLLARYDQDTHLWRTVQCSLLEDLEQSLETFPRWGMTRNGVCWERTMLELTTNEIESGSWPTPTASQMPSEGSILQYRKLVDNGILSKEEAEGMLMASLNPPRMKKWTPKADTPSGNWPTPQSNDAKNAVVRHRTKSLQVMLGGAVATLDTQAIGGHLNPTWVEWLMGWPLEWTDLKPLETDKSHYVQQQHGTSLKEE